MKRSLDAQRLEDLRAVGEKIYRHQEQEKSLLFSLDLWSHSQEIEATWKNLVEMEASVKDGMQRLCNLPVFLLPEEVGSLRASLDSSTSMRRSVEEQLEYLTIESIFLDVDESSGAEKDLNAEMAYEVLTELREILVATSLQDFTRGLSKLSCISACDLREVLDSVSLVGCDEGYLTGLHGLAQDVSALLPDFSWSYILRVRRGCLDLAKSRKEEILEFLASSPDLETQFLRIEEEVEKVQELFCITLFECSICGENRYLFGCSEENCCTTTCSQCYSQFLLTSEGAHKKILTASGALRCVEGDCRGHYHGHDLMSSLTPSAQVYLDHLKIARAQEEELGVKATRSEQLRHENFYARVFYAELDLLEDVAATRCPSCGVRFFDFDGCAALRCSHCQTTFCALCLCQTPDDSTARHEHVKTCAYRSYFSMSGPYHLELSSWFLGIQEVLRLRREKHIENIPIPMLRQFLTLHLQGKEAFL